MDMPELLLTGGELGLQGRFLQNVGQVVSLCMKEIPALQNWRFGDIHSALDTKRAIKAAGRGEPDLMVCEVCTDYLGGSTGEGRIVGEAKTSWTLKLSRIISNRNGDIVIGNPIEVSSSLGKLQSLGFK
jgi:hypothetical protein